MPHFKESSSSESSDGKSDFRARLEKQSIVGDSEYAGVTFDNSFELPLSEQLEPIAVIGMGCRLPGDVKSPSEFWKMMMNKQSGQTPKVPSSRFNIDAHFHENNERPGSFKVLGGYFLNETLQEFDPGFFGITPIEAMWMDPQQRKLLEVVYEAFESAGVTLDQLSGSDTACFMATFTADFQQMSFKEPSFRHSLAATGVDPGIISNRISHVFNLRGPSIVVNTACSSSVYAIHNACNALRTGECGAAVVGGSNLVLTVDQHMNTAKLGVLSPTSTCHTFNSYANGYGRAEGVGAVYLKRLADAIRDGDAIRGVIRSSATNSNGKAPAVGITYPGFDGQRNVIRHAYSRGGQLDPRLTGYFECHGTGTAIGDPLEVNAVSDIMNLGRTAGDGPLLIGAVKPNIGHSEAASGLSAVIKAILTVERGVIPPTYGVTELNLQIDWEGWNVKVPTEPTPFPKNLPVKRVSVNSFGYGGTNAHIIVEGSESLLTLPQSYKFSALEGKKRKIKKLARGSFNRNKPYLLVFSAHDRPTLERNVTAHGAVAAEYDLLDLSYTLANRRTHFSSRGMVVTSAADLQTSFDDGLRTFVFAEKKKVTSIGFVFTGQGAQWAMMGAELMAYYPTFLESIRQLDGVLEELEDAPDWTLEDVLLENASASRINKAEFAQPLCTAIQVALVKLLQLWGVKPAVTCGHSSGEIAAAFAAGYLTASQAIIAAYYRGKAVQGIDTNGAMLAVGIGAEDVGTYLADYSNEEVTVACHNSPSSVTLSGNAEVLQEIQQRISKSGKFAKLVKTDGKAYHSHHMQPAAAKYEAFIKHAEQYLPDESLPAEKARMVSSVTNAVIPEDMILDHTYWSANLLSPVLFNQAIQTMIAKFPEIDGLVEIGPHSALSGPINQIKAELQMEKLHYLPTLIRGVDSARSLLRLAGELFLRQYPLNLQRATSLEEATPSGKIRRRSGNLIVDLPPYQWDKNKKYWAESRESKEHRYQKFPRHDLLGQLTIGTSLAEPTWRNVLRVKDLPWLKDHSLGGEAVFPAAGYFSMAMEAITQISSMSVNPVDIECYVLRDVLIQQALVTPDDDNGIEVLLNMRPSPHGKGEGQDQWWEFNVSSVSQEGYVKNHMVGNIGINTRRQPNAPKNIPNLPQRATGKSWNQALKKVGFNYGPTFQDMDNITFDGRTYCAHADTRVKTTVDGMVGESRHILHPATVDSCLQLMIVAIWAGRTKAMQFGAVPVRAEEVVIWKPTDDQVSAGTGTVFSWIDPRGQRSFNAHTQLRAADGKVLMDISNMRCAAYEAAIPLHSEQPAKPQPYAGLVSKLDVEFVAGVQEAMDIADYVELADFKNPGLRVLAVNKTDVESILAKVPGLDLTATHDLTEVVGLLGQRLADFKNTKVQVLDLNKDLSEQSIKLNSFDLVITSYISSEALDRTRSLLVEGGRAIVDAPDLLDEQTMVEAGFSSVMATLQSSSTGRRAFVVSAAEPPTESTSLTSKFQLIYRNTAPTNVSSLADELKSMGHEVELFRIGSSGPIGPNAILLVDLEGPFLATVTERELKDLQMITSTATNITWVAGQDPECAMAKGLLRCLRAERASLMATFVELDAITVSSAQFSKVAKLATLQASDGAALEPEYSISNGQIFISRLIPIERINHDYGHDEAEPESVPFDSKKRLVGKVVVGKVVFEHGPGAESPLAPEEVEVAVLATGLNRHDVFVISGTEFLTDFSHEISGVVCRTGSEVQNLAPGDEVVGFSSSKFATFQYTDQCLLQKLEPGESCLTMASLPMQYAAALYGLENLANLQAGESVFILPGSGLVGAAAVHVTRALHGVPYVAVLHASEAEETARSLGLELSQIVDWSTQSSEQLVADIVFSTDAVEPSVAREAWRHLSPFSRFVGCADKDTVSSAVIDSVPITRGVSYFSFNVINLFKKPKVLGQLLARTVQLVRQGAVSAPIVSARNITEINDSITSFEDGISCPKIVIEHKGTGSGTLQVIPSRPRLQLRPDATYFLVGCLGGLGRALTSWMMGRGARNFAFLSRSGTDSKQAAILVDDLKAAGINVQLFRGDASVKEDVWRAITSVSPDRPVRGVVNAAMVLRDGIFPNMSYDNWVTSIRPKVLGSRNLHEATQGLDLDFFIMTSSVSGILGTPGQANYAAGNSYMDSLAQVRRSQGLKAVSIALPMVLGVGVVAENVKIEDSLKRKGMYGIEEEGLLDAFEVAILEQEDSKQAIDHLVVGLDPTLLRRAKQEAGGEVDAFWAADPRFSALCHEMDAGAESSANSGSDSILAKMKAAASPEEAMALVSEEIKMKLSRLLMVELDEFTEEGRSVASYGIDSMIGAEFRNWIFRELALDIAFQQLLGPNLTIGKLSEMVYAW